MSPYTRRRFLRKFTSLTAGLAFHQAELFPASVHDMGKEPTAFDPGTLTKFVDPLPIPPIARPNGTRPSPADPKLQRPYYRIPIREFQAKAHRNMRPTRWWGYGGTVPGPTFETRSGSGLTVEWFNELPAQHFLPIDHTLHGANVGTPEVRTVVHVHGAKAPPDSDGYPDDWVMPGKSNLYHYPNQQEAAMLWYHDHAMGINRLNIYAGLFGAFFVRDPAEDSLLLPDGKYEVPIALFDRMFTLDHQLLYPQSGNPEKPWVPEVFGNAILVNGKLFPYLDVEARLYRFRILNASNGRFYRLSLGDGLPFYQIGTDQGLLPAPVSVKTLLIAPGERADVLIDFSEHRGARLILNNDAFIVMQFRVAAGRTWDTRPLPSTLRPVPKLNEAEAVKVRMLTLDEYDNLVAEPMVMLLNGTYWHQPITEKPQLNSTEVWTFINPTDDSHPIHLHLVRFQILDRRRYEPWAYQTKGELKFLSPPIPPDASEAGWKDTVRADPKMVTRIIVRFEGYPGRYVWHCHILEHEDNEMMRPYEVVSDAPPARRPDRS
jgi:spore coat protein A, manganese oxidase